MIAFYLAVLIFGAYFLISSFLAFAPVGYSVGFVRLLDAIDRSINRDFWLWFPLAWGLLFVTEACWLRWL